MSQETQYYHPAPFLSHFRTTLRNELHSWMAHVVIYAAYFVSIYFLGHGIFYGGLISFINVFYFVSAIPVLIQLVSWNYWNMGFKSRVQSFFVSILVLVCFFLKEKEITLRVFWVIAISYFIVLLFRLLIARKRHAPDFLAIVLTFILVLIGYFSINLYVNTIWRSIFMALVLKEKEIILWVFWVIAISCFIVLLFKLLITRKRHAPDFLAIFLIFILVLMGFISINLYVNTIWRSIFMALVLFAFSLVPILQIISRAKNIKRLEVNDRSHNFNIFLRYIFIRSFFFTIVIIISVKSDSLLLSSILTLAILSLSTDSGLFFSRQKAHLADVIRFLGLKHVSISVSPNPLPIGIVNIWLDRLKRIIDQNRQYGSVLLILLSGGMLIPYLAYRYGLANEYAELFNIGITSSFGLLLIYLTLWFINNRKKHIVIPFSVAEGQDEPQLQSLANLVTYTFIEQLRYIALLLSMKQVENIASRNDNTLPVFITSGQDKELIQQVRSLGDLEIANNKIPFGGLLAFVGNSLAHTKVRGTIVRQKDNSIAILVEFIQRGGQIVAVDIAFVPETSASDLDEKIVNNIAQSLAVKLIIKLGNHSHLASSWKSLLYFIKGLDAGYHRNWWQAISFYRKSIQYEESVNGPTGSAYYHLGASLISQGNIIDGYKYLKTAETKNAPQAEVQYMMALTEFYLFHDYLHFERVVFDDIKWRCLIAIKSRPYFPEAHHLLGTLNYHRGKLLERAFTKTPQEDKAQYSRIDILPQDYSDDYKNAVRELSKAIKGYDRALRLLPTDLIAQGTIFDERAKLIRYRMSATHRLGDALRSLERYSESDMYYQETLYAFPANVRTLVDRAKTYCFSGNWQKADEYIRNNIFNIEEYRSNKSANFYMGWAIAGGLVDKFSLSSRFTDYFIRIYERLSIFRRTDNLEENHESLLNNIIPKIRKNTKSRNSNKNESVIPKQIHKNIYELRILLGKSMLYLDFAIQQYPRYIYRWKQTNWFDDFNQAVMELRPGGLIKPKNLRKLCYSKRIDIISDCYVDQIYYWLCWRVASRLPRERKQIDNIIRGLVGWKSLESLRPYIPNEDFYPLFKCLLNYREEYENLLKAGDNDGVLCNLKLRQKKIDLGKRMINQWHEASRLIKLKVENLLAQKDPDITFSDRWAIDVFADYSMLACHILAESEAYESVDLIGNESKNILKAWLSLWRREMTEQFFFSPKVLDYQLASICSWLGYSRYMMLRDFPTQNRLIFSDAVNLDEYDSLGVQSIIDEAMKFAPNNPLAIFVNALLLKRKRRNTKAADELNRLLSLISPFDPHVYSRRNSYIENFELANRRIAHLRAEDIHKDLIYEERSCGDLQFSVVMSISQIHLHLAEIARELGEVNTSIGNMILAFADTPYQDEQAEILLMLAEILNIQGQYPSALAVLDEAMGRRKYFSPVGLPNVRSLQVLVLECILKTNMEDYRDSLERGLEMSETLGNEDLSNEHNSIINYFTENNINNTCISTYKVNILSKFEEIESKAKFDDIVGSEEKLFELINRLKENNILELLNNLWTSTKLQEGEHILTNQQSEIDLNLILTSQVLTAMFKDIINFIIQQCEWMNNCAFNYCELGFNLDRAKEYVDAAVAIMNKLKEIGNPLDLGEWKRRLAQYYDTLGWIYYRKGQLVDLQYAYEILSNQALNFEQESPLIYYHLARVRLTQIERIWQGLPWLSGNQVTINDEKALSISKYLREAFLYWRNAHRLDHERNLYSRLRIVRVRIDRYRRNWEKHMMPLEENIKGCEKDKSKDAVPYL